MKTILFSILFLTSAHAFSMNVDYGFLNQGVNDRVCFVGVSGATDEYSGSMAMTQFSEEQQELMRSCQAAKESGKPAILLVSSITEPGINPVTGVKINQVSLEVECVTAHSVVFEEFLQHWRSEVKASSFRSCPK